jgi:hypothetical protein
MAFELLLGSTRVLLFELLLGSTRVLLFELLLGSTRVLLFDASNPVCLASKPSHNIFGLLAATVPQKGQQ